MRNVLAGFLTTQRDRLPLFLPVFMGAGILAYFARTTEPPLSAAALITAVCIAATAATWRLPLIRAPLLCAAFAAAGFTLACLATARAPGWIALPRLGVDVTGRIETIDILPAGRRVTLASPSLDGGETLARALRIRLRTNDPAALAPGDDIRLRCLLLPPAPPGYPGGWDTQRDAYFAGLGGYGFAIGPVQLLHHAPGNALARLREAIARRIIQALPGTQGAIAATLLTGIGTAIPAADRAAFEASGLAHLLAVAGLHIGFVMGLVFFAARLALAASEYAALAWPTRKLAAIAALAAGFLYLEITGAHVPILRSFGMAALVTLGVLTGRRAISLRGLALAATAVMALTPQAIMGVSFQMSFSAVLCLISGYDLARPALRRLGDATPWRRPLLYVAGLILCSFLAGTASAPFAAYHFGRASLYYIPANMLAVPVTAFWVMPWGLATLALMPLGLEHLTLVPMGWGIACLTAIAHTVSGWPAANLPVAQTPAWSPALLAAGLAWAGLFRGRLRLAGAAPILAALLLPLLVPAPDLLVGPEARLIALKQGPRIVVSAAPDLTAYERQSPERLWGTTPASSLTCDAGTCRTPLIAIDSSDVACTTKVIVSPTWLHDPCPGAIVIDHAFVQREGATVVRVTRTGPVTLTDRDVRGTRPWVISTRPKLPMAATE